MDVFTDAQNNILYKIEDARRKLNIELENGVILEQDIICLLSAREDFGLKTINRQYSYKESVLKSIYNSPFILCDQNLLSFEVKKLIPQILKKRYMTELKELNYHLKNCFISYNEYIFLKRIIDFCYYESSLDGKNIKETGHCKRFYKK